MRQQPNNILLPWLSCSRFLLSSARLRRQYLSFAIFPVQVAKALNADMILVANGGLGSAYDELELNRGICEKYGIKVRGVVLNKVTIALEEKW